ncbi:asparagine rich [Schistosoma japonicum]|uniref:Asparagine rich n=1 Tax=Schistosoma japonicum TaxID=6182 RepID=A0A4Z2CY14_SCHJA|nr:asparagine rich [Schistosoma japonicum]
MSTNHDVYKLPSTLSNQSINFKAQNHKKCWSKMNNHEDTWSSSCNQCIRSNESSKCMIGHFTPCSSNSNAVCQFTTVQDQTNSLSDKYYYNDMNIIQSLRKNNAPNNNKYISRNTDPLDYSIHSLMNNFSGSAFTLNKSNLRIRSDYIQASDNQDIQDHIQSSHISRSITEPNGCCTNTENSNGPLLKRKYSINPSNIPKKYTGKHSKTEMKTDSEFSHSTIKVSDRITVSHITSFVTNQLPSTNTSDDTYSPSKTAYKRLNSIPRKKIKIDKDLQKNIHEVTNSSTMITTDYSNSKVNEDENTINTSSIDNKSIVKKTSDTRAAYKYLTWREKDRRRRFREEWKHLWLVIPHGLYEVMCLVCHKVMTQRKVDTIKRHTVRRHVELIGMSDSEREKLFNQLISQYSMLEAANHNLSADASNKLHQKSNSLHHTNSSVNFKGISNMRDTGTCWFGQLSSMNSVNNTDMENKSLKSETSNLRCMSVKKHQQLNCKPFQAMNVTSRYSRNFLFDKYGNLPEQTQNGRITGNFKDLPTNIPSNLDDASRFSEKSPSLQISLTDALSDSCSKLHFPQNEDQFHMATVSSKSMTSNPISTTSPFSPFPITIPIPKCFSCTKSSESEDLHSFLKSCASMNFQFSSSRVPTSSISSLVTSQNSDKLPTSTKPTSNLYTNSDINYYITRTEFDNKNNNMDITTIQSHQSSLIEVQTVMSDYQNRLKQKSGSTLNTETILENYNLVSIIENMKLPHRQQFSSSNICEDSYYKSMNLGNSSVSSIPGVPGSLSLSVGSSVTGLLNQETGDAISLKTSKSKLNSLGTNKNSINVSNSQLSNNSVSSNMANDEKTVHISRKSEKFADSLSSNHHAQSNEQVLYPLGIKSGSKNKSNSDSKQFTISSLLKIESFSSEKDTSLTTCCEELFPDTQKKNKLLQRCNYSDCSIQRDCLQENQKFKQLPVPCVLCDFQSSNTCTNEINKDFTSNIASEDILFKHNNGSFDISPTKQFDKFRERQSAFTNLTGLSNASIIPKVAEYNTNISDVYQSYTDIFYIIYCLKNRIPINFTPNPSIFYTNNSEALETYTKLYYLELLRHLYDAPYTHHSNQSFPTSLCPSMREESKPFSITKLVNELEKSQTND